MSIDDVARKVDEFGCDLVELTAASRCCRRTCTR